MKIKSKKGYVTSIEFEDNAFLDAEWLEVLLNIDNDWKSIREILKYSKTKFGIDACRTFFKHLCDTGLIERRKINNHRIAYRRIHKYPKHHIGGN
tara:strand:+ start:541 stop:825 length:285 start_codon:yes stop_codon:yes gene_type:complete